MSSYGFDLSNTNGLSGEMDNQSERNLLMYDNTYTNEFEFDSLFN
jgi:hypothetical protein